MSKQRRLYLKGTVSKVTWFNDHYIIEISSGAMRQFFPYDEEFKVEDQVRVDYVWDEGGDIYAQDMEIVKE